MNNIVFNLFPNGKKRAVTFSYDDGAKADYKMTEIFDRYGAKCTYNLNSGRFDQYHIDKAFVRELGERHEVAIHGVNHPFWERLPHGEMLKDIIDDKDALEDIIGKPIIGGAYPYGTYNEEVVKVLDSAGIKYCRTTMSTKSFQWSKNMLELSPTCHHNDCVERAKLFVNTPVWNNLPLFYIWGHSFEFENANNWEILDDLFAILGETDTIYYATNGELYDYYRAIQSLRITNDKTVIVNPTATTVYATVNGVQTALTPGKTIL